MKGIPSDITLEEIMPVNSFEKQLDKKEECTARVWKDELIETVTEEIQE